MAQVTLRINGYAYTVGCQDGEDQHLQGMAGEVERRIEGIKSAIGQSGESRMLVMAALMMADDLYESDKKQSSGGGGGEAVAAKPDPKLGRKLGKLAKQAEEIAARLETP